MDPLAAIRTFVRVIESGSFSAAARVAGIGTEAGQDFYEVRLVLREYEPAPLSISAVRPAGRRLPAKLRVFIEFLARIFAEEPTLAVDHSSTTPVDPRGSGGVSGVMWDHESDPIFNRRDSRRYNRSPDRGLCAKRKRGAADDAKGSSSERRR